MEGYIFFILMKNTYNCIQNKIVTTKMSVPSAMVFITLLNILVQIIYIDLNVAFYIFANSFTENRHWNLLKLLLCWQPTKFNKLYSQMFVYLCLISFFRETFALRIYSVLYVSCIFLKFLLLIYMKRTRRTSRLRTAIRGSHKMLSHMEFESTTLRVVESGVETA